MQYLKEKLFLISNLSLFTQENQVNAVLTTTTKKKIKL